MRGQDFRTEEKLRELIDVDKAFDSSREKRKDTLNDLEERRRSFEEEAMEKTQRAVLKQLVPQIIEAVENRNQEMMGDIEDMIERTRRDLEDVIEDQEERVDDVESEIGSMKKERKRELEDIHDRISSVQKKIDRSSDEMEEVVESKIDDRIEDVRSKTEKNANRIEEVSKKSKVESLEDVEERLDEFEEKFESKTEQLEERLENDELVASDTDLVDLEEQVKEHQKQVEKLEDRIDDLSEIEIDERLKDEIVDEVRNETGSSTVSKKPTAEEVMNPEEVNSAEVGENVEVKGRLMFKKKAGGRRFYKISGTSGSLVVASEKKIPEGPRTLEGEVRNVNGNVCLVVE